MNRMGEETISKIIKQEWKKITLSRTSTGKYGYEIAIEGSNAEQILNEIFVLQSVIDTKIRYLGNVEGEKKGKTEGVKE